MHPPFFPSSPPTDPPYPNQVLNELLQGSPLTIVSGYIRRVRATIPWKSIFSASCKLEVDGLELHLAPRTQSSTDGE